MNHKNQKSKFNSILNKYKLNMKDTQEFDKFLSGMESTYINVLKRTGKYSFFTGSIIAINFFLKKTGILSNIFNIFLSVGISATVLSGIYFTSVYNSDKTKEEIIHKREKIMSESELIESRNNSKSVDKSTTVDSSQNKTEKPAVIISNIGVKSFKSTSVDNAILRNAESIISSELIRLKGQGYSKLITEQQIRNVNYVLIGSIEKVEDSIILIVKVMHVKTSAILFIVDKNISPTEDINQVCISISKEIANKI